MAAILLIGPLSVFKYSTHLHALKDACIFKPVNINNVTVRAVAQNQSVKVRHVEGDAIELAIVARMREVNRPASGITAPASASNPRVIQ